MPKLDLLRLLKPQNVQRLAATVLILVATLLLSIRYPLSKPEAGKGVPAGFAVYLEASKNAVKLAVSPYQDPKVPAKPNQFPYSPGVLSFFWFLPQDPGLAWGIFSGLCLFLFCSTLMLGARYSDWNQVLLLAVGIALSWKSILEILNFGQFELLLFGIAGMSAILLGRQAFVAGLLAGILPWIQFTWVILAVPLFAAAVQRTDRKGRLFFSGFLASSFIWGIAIPSLMFGSDRAMVLSQQWVNFIKGHPESLYLSDVNQSLWVSILRWFGKSLNFALGTAGLALGLIAGRMISELERYRPLRRISPLAWISPWMVWTQLVTPFSWRWGSVFLVGIPLSAALVDLPKDGEKVHYSPKLFLGLAVAFWFFNEGFVISQMGLQDWKELNSVGLTTLGWVLFLIFALIKNPFHEIAEIAADLDPRQLVPDPRPKKKRSSKKAR